MLIKTNIAPSSAHGHFVGEAVNVVNIDQVNETFLIEVQSETELSSANHLSLPINEDCLIICQKTFNGFSALYEKSKD